jgi:hypothetical protein
MKTIKIPCEEEFQVLKKISVSDPRKKVRQRAKIILLRLTGLVYRT